MREISDAIGGHSEISLKLGHSGSEGKVLVFRCHRLRFARGMGGFASAFLKPVFRQVEGVFGSFGSFKGAQTAEE